MQEPGPRAQTAPTRASVRTLEDETPVCPRCGYDLSVSTQLWPDDRCPTSDTCSECGLVYRWSEVLHPSLCPKWFVGHRLRNPLAWARAALVPLVPWRAMREAPLSMSVKPVRELVAPAVLLTLWYALMVIATRLHMWLFNPQPVPWYLVGRHQQPLRGYHVPLHTPSWWESLLWFREERQLLTYSGAYNSFTVLPVLLMLLLTPLMFLTLGTTMRRSKVRPVHLMRLFAISAVPVATLLILQLVSRGTLDALKYESIFTPPAWEWLDAYIGWSLGGWRAPPILTWPFLTLVLFLGWLSFLWYGACRWYLRLPSPGFHAFVLLFTSLLATATILMATHSDFRRWAYHAVTSPMG